MKTDITADLYYRLDELEAITRTFVKDVAFFSERLALSQPVEIDSGPSAIHRAHVRAVFALMEGLLHQHKSLLLNLSDGGLVTLSEKTVRKLREEKRFMSLEEKVKVICRAAGTAFQQTCRVGFEGSGWLAFGKAIELRNRITHPKSFVECGVQVWDLEAVAEAERWFRAMHNEYVRLARDHREETGWKN